MSTKALLLLLLNATLSGYCQTVDSLECKNNKKMSQFKGIKLFLI